MTPEQENAIALKFSHDFRDMDEYDAIRLAIRAAVAAERERAAKVCEQEHADWFKDPGYDMPDGRDCAAAIRRGE